MRSNPPWRGRSLVYYLDLIQRAAALWESLSQNHPFVDGNKRVAVTMTAAFLTVDGYKLEYDDLDALTFLIGCTKMAVCVSVNWKRGYDST